MRPQRLTILGVGLLGGSIGLAVKSVLNGCEIVGYGHRQSTLDQAVSTGAIDRGSTDLASAVRGADMVILGTPVGLFEQILAQISPLLAEGAVVTDVGSTKRSVVRSAEKLLPKTVKFVASHPIAGSEKRGVEFARADLFRGAICLLTPAESTDPAALIFVETFWQMLGMRTQRLSPEVHDQLLSDVSHLPHAIAAAMVAMQTDDALALSGKGFLDATRIAGGDGGLWRDIFHDNRDNLRAGVERLQGELTKFLSLLDAKNADALKQWLDTAAKRREELLAKKLREMNPD